MSIPVSISYTSESQKSKALAFATKNNYPCLAFEEINTTLALIFTDDFTELRDMESNSAIHIDFISGELAHRQLYGGGRGQSIAKAIGLKQGKAPPSVIDATAGLAKDAFVLATLGCPIILLERSTVIVELINDALTRAKEDNNFSTILNTGFNLIHKSSIEYLKNLISLPDVIYLDPMYPQRKKSASVKKSMQILQKLLNKDEDSSDLLELALLKAKKRVVVKRPKGAAILSRIKPSYEVSSKNTRYDIYLTNNS